MTDRAAKAWKLIEALAEEHAEPWHTCRHCLASEEISYPSTRPLLVALIKERDTLRAAGAMRLAKRQRYLEKRPTREP